VNTISALQNAIDFIENKLGDEINPDMITKEVCLSTFHFQRLFFIFFWDFAGGKYPQSASFSSGRRDQDDG
jgi:hypothetical protein